MNRKRRVSAIAAYVTMLFAVGATGSSAQMLQISLEQRFGRAGFRSCDLNVRIVERTGRSAMRCVWNTSRPVADLRAERALTSQETERLRALMAGGEILSGTATGKDVASTDGITETVTIYRGGALTVLVASGNPSFDAGSRRQLLNLLHSILEDLVRRAAPK